MQSSHSVGSSNTFFRPRDYSDRLLEDECIEESRSPTADAGIMPAEHPVDIKLFRPRQRHRLRDGREEAVPRDYRGDGVKGVLLACPGLPGDGQAINEKVRLYARVGAALITARDSFALCAIRAVR
jgi:hypothetical protein